MGKLPAFQFYPADWRKDPGVQSLSYHDRAVWFEMLCFMHESPIRGKLMLGGKAMTDEILAGLLHLDLASLKSTIATLIERNVTERDKRTGALINRRMLRDEEALAKNRQKLNKWRKEQKIKENCNQPVTTGETQLLPLSSSTSSSSVSTSSSTSVCNVKTGARAPKSPGANGEFMLATHLWQELNYAADSRDVDALAAVIQAESKAARASPEDTAAQLLAWAQEAQARGEVINRFWFKDRRYTGNGNHKPKPKVDETFDELRRHYGVAH